MKQDIEAARQLFANIAPKGLKYLPETVLHRSLMRKHRGPLNNLVYSWGISVNIHKDRVKQLVRR